MRLAKEPAREISSFLRAWYYWHLARRYGRQYEDIFARHQRLRAGVGYDPKPLFREMDRVGKLFVVYTRFGDRLMGIPAGIIFGPYKR